MKKTLFKQSILMLSFLFSVGFAFSQVPELMSYQSVIRRTNNDLVVNQNVRVKISILQGSITGSAVYSEQHQTTTNSNGLVAISIGAGTSPTGSFSAINWQNGPYFVKMEADPTGGTNYTVSGTSQLLSVPYALNSKKADNGIDRVSLNGDSLYLSNGQVFVKTNSGSLQNGSNSGEMLYWNGTSWLTISAGANGQKLTFCNGKPIWTANGECPPTLSSAQYPLGTVHCGGTATAVFEITNPLTGKVWMDRNLGADRRAISITDTNAYGDLYQWGRGADGHQCRNSITTNVFSSTDQPGNSSFISAYNTPYDWRNTQNDSLWQGVNGINNPCPSGFRLPTETEWNAELVTFSTFNASSSAAGAFASPLKLPSSGVRNYDGSYGVERFEPFGFYWSSSVGGIVARRLEFSSYGIGEVISAIRAFGGSVRCIKN
jgi:uncharacterized protein (TIGR02145 family)